MTWDLSHDKIAIETVWHRHSKLGVCCWYSLEHTSEVLSTQHSIVPVWISTQPLLFNFSRRETTETQRKTCDAFAFYHRHVCKHRAQHVDTFVFYHRHVCKIPHPPTPRHHRRTAQNMWRVCVLSQTCLQAPSTTCWRVCVLSQTCLQNPPHPPPKPRDKRAQKNNAKHLMRLCSIKDMFAKYPTPPPPWNPVTRKTTETQCKTYNI